MKLDFKNNDQVQKFALKLIHCESPEELEKILKDYNLWDVSNWRFYGDNSNNIGTIGNQSPDASKALVEKITNSIDARFLHLLSTMISACSQNVKAQSFTASFHM